MGGTINPYGYAEIENVKFLNNNLSGLHVQYSSALITNCQFSGNNYGLSSGGLFTWDGQYDSLIVNHSTIAGNVTSGLGMAFGGSAYIFNSIIADNNNQNVSFHNNDVPNEVRFGHSLIEGGESTVITNDNGTVDYSIGENYFDANAGFKNVDEGDYTLTDTSPAIGRASNLISYNNRDYISPDQDINGLSRPNPSGTIADLGAYESSEGD